MESTCNSDENSRMETIAGIDMGRMSPNKTPLSSKATAFSIAAIMGGESIPATEQFPSTSTDRQDALYNPLGKYLFLSFLNFCLLYS